jgi:predicted small lipoprotein YifL
MLRAFRVLTLAAIVGGTLTACADQSPITGPGDASFAKSGTAASGGNKGGSTTTTPDKPSNSTPSSPTGAPVGPSYVGYITRIGEVPVGLYYGKPTSWDVNGYRFESVYTTNYKPVTGGFVLGACVTVNFYESADQRIMQEMKTIDPAKCK